MKKTVNPYLENQKCTKQVERLQKMGAKAFQTASAYGCGRNPIDMQKLQKTGMTSAFVSLSPSGDLH